VIRLRPYQQEVARAVLKSILGHKGLTFSVEMSRQAGKNELSAQLEALLLTFFMAESKTLSSAPPLLNPRRSSL